MPNIYDKPVYLDFKNTYVGKDLNRIQQAAMAMDQRGAQSEQMQYEMENDIYKVNALQEDKASRDAKIAEYDQQIAEALEGAGGDYTKMLPFMKEERKKLQRDLMMGDFADMQKNYTAYNTWREKNEDRVNDGDISRKEFEMASALARNNYTGYEDGDIALRNLVNQHNYGEIAMDIASKMKANTTQTLGQWVQGTGMDNNDLPPGALERMNVKVTSLSAEEINAVVDSYIRNNPIYQEHLNQKTQLEMENYEMLLKHNETTWKETKGFDDEDRALMEEMEMNPDSPEDQRKYFRTIFQEEIKNNIIQGAARPAAVAFDQYDVEYDSDIFKNPAAKNGTDAALAGMGAVFVSPTPGNLTTLNYDEIKTQSVESRGNAETFTEQFVQSLADEGLTTFTNNNISTEEDRTKVDNFLSDLHDEQKATQYVWDIYNKKYKDNEAYTESTGLDEAKRDLARMRGAAETTVNSWGLVDQQESVYINAENSALKKIKTDSPDRFDNVANRMNSYSQDLRGVTKYDAESLETTLMGIENESEFNAIFGTKMEQDRSFGSAGSIPQIDAQNSFRKAAYNLWKDLHDKTINNIQEGFVQNYTQIDMARLTKNTAVNEEFTAANIAFNDGGRDFTVNGVSTSLAKAFGVENHAQLSNISSSIIFDKGRPVYRVTADVNTLDKWEKGGTQTIEVELGGREHQTRTMMNALTQNDDPLVQSAAKTYLGAEMMGTYYDSNRIDALKPGQEYPIRLKTGKLLGVVKRNSHNEFIVVAKDPNNPNKETRIRGLDKNYTKASAIAEDLYTWYQSVYLTQKAEQAQLKAELAKKVPQ